MSTEMPRFARVSGASPAAIIRCPQRVLRRLSHQEQEGRGGEEKGQKPRIRGKGHLSRNGGAQNPFRAEDDLRDYPQAAGGGQVKPQPGEKDIGIEALYDPGEEGGRKARCQRPCCNPDPPGTC